MPGSTKRPHEVPWTEDLSWWVQSSKSMPPICHPSRWKTHQRTIHSCSFQVIQRKTESPLGKSESSTGVTDIKTSLVSNVFPILDRCVDQRHHKANQRRKFSLEKSVPTGGIMMLKIAFGFHVWMALVWRYIRKHTKSESNLEEMPLRRGEGRGQNLQSAQSCQLQRALTCRDERPWIHPGFQHHWCRHYCERPKNCCRKTKCPVGSDTVW